ncbi:hypothetical protein L2E82_35879 [Cichorium intybus]|uniref:Uncharacterized protein n=1 Tax=Cichorium intybus TaxID=13427 RepID=A0ACB9BQ40_CICIN|nr:hypothetical protein L2E82_35879 [Cichorium intybus]
MVPTLAKRSSPTSNRERPIRALLERRYLTAYYRYLSRCLLSLRKSIFHWVSGPSLRLINAIPFQTLVPLFDLAVSYYPLVQAHNLIATCHFPHCSFDGASLESLKVISLCGFINGLFRRKRRCTNFIINRFSIGLYSK